MALSEYHSNKLQQHASDPNVKSLIYPLTSDLNFQSKIYKKREFHSNKVPEFPDFKSYEDIKYYRDTYCTGPTKLRPQQQLLTNFIHPDTPYRGVIVFSGTGTGKTRTGIAISDNFKPQVTRYGTKIYVLVPGKLIKENWYSEIADYAYSEYNTTGNNNIYEYGEKINKENRMNIIRHNIKEHYKIMTYKSFMLQTIGQKITESYTEIVGDKNVKVITHKKDEQGNYKRNQSSNKINNLNNTLLILDEAHYITGNDTGLAIREIINKSVNLKIVILTATPMTNIASEIVELINLIRPVDDPMRSDQIFTYDVPGIQHTIKLKENGLDYFKKMANGYISHLRGDKPLLFAEKMDKGEILKNLMFTKLIQCFMLKFQLNVYMKHLSAKINVTELSDSNLDKLDKISSAISNFVFPYMQDGELIGIYGIEGLNKLIALIRSTNKHKFMVLLYEKLLQKTHSSSLGDVDVDKLIEYDEKQKSITGDILLYKNIDIFSIKFKILLDNLKQIFESTTNESKTCFIYSNLVKIGVELLRNILLRNGFMEFDASYNYSYQQNTIDYKYGLPYSEYIKLYEPNTFMPATFMIITGTMNAGEDETVSEQKKYIIDTVFNNFTNIEGKYLKIIIGSKVISEGITLENVGDIHILDAYYTLGRLYQAIGRGVRECKHYLAINDKNKFPKVGIYKYVASLQDNISAEEILYEKAEHKYLLIKTIERAMKETAIDCPLLYSTNVFKTEMEEHKNCEHNGNKKKIKCPEICDFMGCNFKCYDNQLNMEYYDATRNIYKTLKIEDLDYSTFNKDMAKSEIDLIKNIIKYMYKFESVYNLNDIETTVKSKYPKEKLDLYDVYFVYKALDQLMPITNNDFNNFQDYVIDKENNKGYIAYENNLYVLKIFVNNYQLNYIKTNIDLSTYLQYIGIQEYGSSLNGIYTNYQIDDELMNDTIAYYQNKNENQYIGYMDLVKNEIVFKIRKQRVKSIKLRGTGIQTIKGTTCKFYDLKFLHKVAKAISVELDETNKYNKELICDLIKNRLLKLEKYQLFHGNEKITYVIIPKYIASYPFPYNLEDRALDIVARSGLNITIQQINKPDNEFDLKLTCKKQDMSEDIAKSYGFILRNNTYELLLH